MEFLRRNPYLFSVLILVVTLVIVFRVQAGAAAERKEQICISVIEDRLVLRDVVQFATGGSQDPRALAFMDYVNRRLELPPKICEGTGVNLLDLFEAPPPNVPGAPTPPGITPTTTLTTQPTSAERPVYVRIVPDRIDQPQPTTTSTTTTTSTSTTTTTRCLATVADVCVPRR